ncbi:monooxygenase [Micromonospora sp. DR5-3]|uniref:monooxygenase n=1 Tax=unclassified Micromonospora TaxID=2617518 RepID=UPI0011D61F02|nr:MULTISPECIES: monooxygenase [unclassified Micromonospora]MCW3819017.1 monooxygenase [Micromonospora sp. DR5-3]TYC21031.1 monooxygenase [Micromonospora sp. MP36]
MSPPELVTLHVWRIPRAAVPGALVRMAVHPPRLRRAAGVRFAKLLGTGTGTGFGPGDADPTRWAALVAWDSPAAAAGFDASPVGRSWARIARSSVRLELRPLTSRGAWSGRRPFGEPSGGPVSGPVLALTRARLRARRAVTFWRAVPPVAAALHAAPGLLARFGVGEAPLGWQGTVSVWRDAADLVAFAYRQPEHRAAITRTPIEGWYAEELFARFAVGDVVGDRAVLGWAAEGDPETARGRA